MPRPLRKRCNSGSRASGSNSPTSRTGSGLAIAGGRFLDPRKRVGHDAAIITKSALRPSHKAATSGPFICRCRPTASARRTPKPAARSTFPSPHLARGGLKTPSPRPPKSSSLIPLARQLIPRPPAHYLVQRQVLVLLGPLRRQRSSRLPPRRAAFDVLLATSEARLRTSDAPCRHREIVAASSRGGATTKRLSLRPVSDDYGASAAGCRERP